METEGKRAPGDALVPSKGVGAINSQSSCRDSQIKDSIACFFGHLTLQHLSIPCDRGRRERERERDSIDRSTAKKKKKLRRSIDGR
jgi:hypothetical protein